jgi:nicotinamide-nucleotide adenylyltransferase
MRGLFIGRFQPFHKGHAAIVESALEQVESLIVVIGSAECSHTPDNPFTAGERIQMILHAGDELGWGGRLVPVPVRDVNRYAVWVDHVLSYVPSPDVVFSNNPITKLLFREKGIEVRSTPLIERTELSGTSIRSRMVSGEKWENSVPDSVAAYINSVKGVERMMDVTGKVDK